MIFILKDLTEISTKVQNEVALVESELKQLPKGRLTCEKQGNQLRFVKEIYEGKKRKRRNLNMQDPELIGLLKRCILEAELNQLKSNLLLLNYSIEGLSWKTNSSDSYELATKYKRHSNELLNLLSMGVNDFDFSNEIYKLKNSFLQHRSGCRQSPKSNQKEKEFIRQLDELFSKALAEENADDWSNQPYKRLQYHDDCTKWHITSFGLRVRSKSELMIAEMLHKYELPFRYEQLLNFDSGPLAPDFTVRRADGKLMYWEHEGLTNSDEYLHRQLKKSQIYAMNHIVPWDNLIVTYDNSDGLIDMRIVESEILNKLMIC